MLVRSKGDPLERERALQPSARSRHVPSEPISTSQYAQRSYEAGVIWPPRLLIDLERTLQVWTCSFHGSLSRQDASQRTQGDRDGWMVFGRVDPLLDRERSLQLPARSSQIALGLQRPCKHVQQVGHFSLVTELCAHAQRRVQVPP